MCKGVIPKFYFISGSGNNKSFSDKNLKAIIKAYELDEYHLKIGSYGSLISNVIAKYHDGTPVLYCAWELHWVHQHLKIGKDVVWLKGGSNHFKSNHLKILANSNNAIYYYDKYN